MISKSKTMACPFCGERNMFNCQKTVKRSRSRHDQRREMCELPAWRCYSCGVKIVVSNPSALPPEAVNHSNSSTYVIE